MSNSSNTQLFLNIDARHDHNSIKDQYQVIHVETFTTSVYAIGACFIPNGEIPGTGRNSFDKVSISKLILKKISGESKKNYDAKVCVSNKDPFLYELKVFVEDDLSNDTESFYTPTPLNKIELKRCLSNDSFDVTIIDSNPKPITDPDKIGPKICQFRIA
ncbi:hypothetical protein [uncultured Aquimarina sp.]|uniref:hypothetical protein n=1 Tax=uncultured Aquimarina sp. TaxID=575652 RepID=UPI002605C388|nr:hypothetical protein [uncultured Aquimarina sp.]